MLCAVPKAPSGSPGQGATFVMLLVTAVVRRATICLTRLALECLQPPLCPNERLLQQVRCMQEYERVHRMNMEQGNRAFALGATPIQLLKAISATPRDTLAQLPLMCPDIGKNDESRSRHTRLVAHLAVAYKLTTDREVNLEFDLPDQMAPRAASNHTKLHSMQLRQQIDAWLAALLEAAGKSLARHVKCSTYVLQAAARHEHGVVLGHSRLAYQFPAFRQKPQVSVLVNTPHSDLATGLMWRALRDIPCLDLNFTVGQSQQCSWLQKLPAGSIQCFGVSGCDVHAPGMLTALCGALHRFKELKSFKLGAIAQKTAVERPLGERSIKQLQRSLLRPARIVAVSMHSQTVQDQVCSPCCSLPCSVQHGSNANSRLWCR